MARLARDSSQWIRGGGFGNRPKRFSISIDGFTREKVAAKLRKACTSFSVRGDAADALLEIALALTHSAWF